MVVISETRSSAHDLEALKATWAAITADSCPYHYNFHLHTHCSDGQLTPEALIEQAVTLGLEGLAITDHHTVEGYRQARGWLDRRGSGNPCPHFWTGIEITSRLLDTEVHLLGYGFDPEHPALAPYLQKTAPEGENARVSVVVERLHRAGALVVLAHPSRYPIPATRVVPAAAEAGIDGIEAFYAYGNPKPWRPSQTETEIALELARKYGLYNTCGTDSHGTSLLQRI
jgi:predicted metal-dependent phosphoesterase TrpH